MNTLDKNSALGQILAAAGVDLNAVRVKKQDTDVIREGKKIILPSDPKEMPIPEAIKTLERKLQEEQQVYSLHEVIDSHPYDALVAFNKAMKELYGWASPISTPGFFGPTPPQMISVTTGPNLEDVMQVPFGSFKLPNIAERVQVHIDRVPFQQRFGLHITTQAKRDERQFLLELVTKAREFVKSESIYRGKAVAATSDGVELEQNLTFFDVTRVSKDDLILNDDTFEQVRVNLWAPVEFTAACKMARIPLKRGVLLEGKYGTGKSLTARVTAKVCQDNGWTFLHIDNVRALRAALTFAEQYAPCVVFAEDIDRVLDERDEAANEIVNTLDGVLSKNAEVITVLTSNHVDRIDQVMLRPGRLDAVITISPPDAKAAEKLIRTYGAGLIDPLADLTEVCNELAGQIPATIREVVERSKLAMIANGETRVGASSLLISAKGMTAHLNLLNRPKEEESKEEKFYNAFRDLLTDVDEDASDFAELSDGVTHGNIRDNVQREGASTRRIVKEALGAAVGEIKETLYGVKNDLADKIDDAA